MDQPSIGSRLAKAREWSGFSASELSRLAGMKSRAHVGLIESGHVEDPGASRLAAIAEALDVPLEWLIRGDGDEAEIRARIEAHRVSREAAADAAREASRSPIAPTGTEG